MAKEFIANFNLENTQSEVAEFTLQENNMTASFEIKTSARDHESLYNRDKANQHPISAITDLESILNSKQDNLSQEQLNAVNSGITQNKVSEYDTHIIDKNNPHEVNKTQLGLENVDNTADLDKPISIAVQNALDGKEDLVITVDSSGNNLPTPQKINETFLNVNTNKIYTAQIGGYILNSNTTLGTDVLFDVNTGAASNFTASNGVKRNGVAVPWVGSGATLRVHFKLNALPEDNKTYTIFLNSRARSVDSGLPQSYVTAIEIVNKKLNFGLFTSQYHTDTVLSTSILETNLEANIDYYLEIIKDNNTATASLSNEGYGINIIEENTFETQDHDDPLGYYYQLIICGYGNAPFSIGEIYLADTTGDLAIADISSLLWDTGVDVVDGKTYLDITNGILLFYRDNVLTEVGKIDLSGYVPITRTINNKALNTDITLTASDVGAVSTTDGITSVVAGSSANKIDVTKNGITSTITVNNVTNAILAEKAIKDEDGNIISSYYYPTSNPNGYTTNTGTVTSVQVQAGTGLSSSTSTAQSTSLNTTISIASGYKLPTTVEWDGKQNVLTAQEAYTAKGTATKVPQITTNTLGQVTKIEEVTITQPTVNNSTITIQKNSTTVDSFTTNAANGKTINIIVPTKVSDLTNDTGFITNITSEDVTSALGYIPYNSSNPNGYTTNVGTVTSVRVQAGTGLSSSTSTAQNTTLNTTISIASGYKLPTTSEWDSKQNNITGGASTITSDNLTASKALVSNASGKVAVSSVTSTELGYLSGVTENIQDQIDDLQARGRFLSLWNGATGLPETDPSGTLPFEYKTGDYYIVDNTSSTTNYRPSGSSYTGAASTTIETESIAANDVYYYDGTNWLLQVNSQREVSFSSIVGQPTDNTNLANALDDKVTKNTAITSATKCKVTYDEKGLVTSGTDLAADDIPDLSSIYLTSHQPIKSLNTDNTTAQTVDVAEIITGNGTINLHKISKTGSYNDLNDLPSINNVVLTGNKTSIDLKINNVYVNYIVDNTSDLPQASGPGSTALVLNAGMTNRAIFYSANSSTNYNWYPDTDLNNSQHRSQIVSDGVNSYICYTSNYSYGYGTIYYYTKLITVDALPNQTDNNGKFLTTDGSTASWANVPAGTVTSVQVQAGTGLSSSQSTAQTSTLNTTISIASGYKLPTTTEWSEKQDTISDLATIRSGAEAGATAVQPGDLATVATSGSYNDLTNKPTIPAAQIQSDWNQTNSLNVDYIKNKPSLATVAISGSYNDLLNKPTIPTVNDAKLTIQKNGIDIDSFTLNQASNATINITVPTVASDIGAVAANATITSATKCKVTYDEKGLVTSGTDLQVSDIPDLSLSKITDVTVTAAQVNSITSKISLTDLSIDSSSTDYLEYNSSNGKFSVNVDTAVTDNSTNLITSGAVKSAIDNMQYVLKIVEW